MGPSTSTAGGDPRTRKQAQRRSALRRAQGLLGLAAVLALGLAGVLAALGMPPFAASSAGSRPVFDGGWHGGSRSGWNGLECADPERQFRVVPAPARSGEWAARYELRPGDRWRGNGSLRCLAARYDTGERAGQDRYFALSLYIPRPGIGDNLLWELHHPEPLYAIPGCGVAPFALLVDRGRLALRIATGDCIEGKGWTTWHPAIPVPGFAPYPRSTWIDVVLHIRFTERPAGLVELWARRGGGLWPAQPLLRRTGIPTLPFDRERGIHGVRLYTQLGLYKGGTPLQHREVAYIAGYRRTTSLADAMLSAPSPFAGRLERLLPARPARR